MMSQGSTESFAAPQDGRLTDAMREDFERDGFIVLRDFVTPAACETLRQHTLELIADFDPGTVRSIFSVTHQSQLNDEYFNNSGDKIRYFFEHDAFDEKGNLQQPIEHSLNKMGHAMHDLDPVYDEFSRSDKLAALVKSLGYDDPGLLQSMYVFKPPRIGGEVTCHQDSTFLFTEPDSCIGLWFALEDATLENGCMQFIPGVHELPLKERNRRQDDGTFAIEVYDDTPWPEDRKVVAAATVGTLAIFKGRTPHMSGPNLSKKSRHAYTLHIIDKACHYPDDNWLQRGPDMPLRGFETN